jgi:hypothetical protein
MNAIGPQQGQPRVPPTQDPSVAMQHIQQAPAGERGHSPAPDPVEAARRAWRIAPPGQKEKRHREYVMALARSMHR